MTPAAPAQNSASQITDAPRPGDGPRPYQQLADAAITRELETLNRRSTLLVMATGTGKTWSFVERTRRCKTHGGRTLILAHRDELIQQPRRKLEALGIHADVEKGKQRASLNAKVAIASVQSLRGARLLRFARDHFDLVIVDEAHHALAPGYRTILDHFDTAKILGVTATPLRADGAALGDVFETVAFRYEIREAIRDGWLVPIVARRIVLDGVDLSAVKTRAGDLAQDQLAALLETERAITGVVVPLLELAGDRPTVLFGVDVAHATRLAAALNDRRPGCARAISGETDDAERGSLLDGFAAGEFQFLCNCALLTEGWDAPHTACVAIVRPTKSWALFVQMAGRGTRPSRETGKRDLLLLNFTGTAGKHRLVGPADCLAGSELGLDAIPDDVRDELDRLLGTQQIELEAVVASATASVAQRRAELARDAVVRFHAEDLDPFLGPEPQASREEYDVAPYRIPPEWARQPPDAKQLKVLDARGVTVSKLPPGFTKAQAAILCIRLERRITAGLCSLAQARALTRAGIPTADLSFERAKELCTKLRIGGWRPWALQREPEYVAAAAEHNKRLVASPDHEALP
jgi:superfamily II DNA or RNA helicase